MMVFSPVTPLIMKTSPMLMVGIALLLSGSAFGRGPVAPDVWTSMKIDQTSSPVFPQGLLLMGITRGEADLV